MPQAIKAIPTTYNGVRFRSRLEAKWAAFMDTVGWRWDYEPIDLNGYIPDFILTRRDIIAEVKPFQTSNEINLAQGKAFMSGWNRDLLIFGSQPFWQLTITKTAIVHSIPIWGGGAQGRRALFCWCDSCDKGMGLCSTGDRCRVCGEFGTRPMDEDRVPIIQHAWKMAYNAVQWKGR